jgi:hypothetical protein
MNSRRFNANPNSADDILAVQAGTLIELKLALEALRLDVRFGSILLQKSKIEQP